MRTIKFKRFFFLDEGQKKLSHSQEWGVNIGHSEFTTPSMDNFTQSFVDCQFTGLQDKNRVDVYEGDILMHKGAKGIVIYENSNAMFMARFPLLRSVYSFDSIESEIEIIGSIHTNPELLNPSNK